MLEAFSVKEVSGGVGEERAKKQSFFAHMNRHKAGFSTGMGVMGAIPEECFLQTSP